MINNQLYFEFWIGGNTPSSKNNKIWTGKFFIVSKATQRWRKLSKQEWLEQRLDFIEAIGSLTKPYHIELTFYRLSKHRFDYINMAQAVFDTMTHYGWISDDDADNIKPYFGDYVYDKQNPGTIIRLIKNKPNYL